MEEVKKSSQVEGGKSEAVSWKNVEVLLTVFWEIGRNEGGIDAYRDSLFPKRLFLVK